MPKVNCPFFLWPKELIEIVIKNVGDTLEVIFLNRKWERLMNPKQVWNGRWMIFEGPNIWMYSTRDFEKSHSRSIFPSMNEIEKAFERPRDQLRLAIQWNAKKLLNVLMSL